jgi:subtilisin family serine protease
VLLQRSLLVVVCWFAAFGLVVSLAPPASGAASPHESISTDPAPQQEQAAGDARPGRYVVILREDGGTARRARSVSQDLGIDVDRQFRHVVNGFAADLTADQVRQLEQDDAVLFVEPNREFKAHALPTGVDRIGADAPRNGARPPRAGSPVAVLDSGIGPHPALNLVGGHNCMNDGTPFFGDGYGHGTHVAGIIGANGAVPGVAPSTPLFAIKVLDSGGVGDLETVLCGLDWVAANHAQYGIKVVNLSLGAPADSAEPESCGGPSALLNAICHLSDDGVTVVTSAGNENEDARFTIPAKYEQAVTVGALTDTDGCRGGRGPASSWGPRDRDDRKWIWSNHGPAVDVVAPGVDIRSTTPGGGYRLDSGTSMAAPHVAAAIALGWNPATGPTQPGIPGFQPNQGLVLLSGQIGCGRQAARPERITIGRATVPPGGKLTVRLTNFEPRERVQISIGARRLGVIVVNANGNARRRLTVPNAINPGVYRVRARGNDGGAATDRIRVLSRERPDGNRFRRGDIAGNR